MEEVESQINNLGELKLSLYWKTYVVLWLCRINMIL